MVEVDIVAVADEVALARAARICTLPRGLVVVDERNPLGRRYGRRPPWMGGGQNDVRLATRYGIVDTSIPLSAVTAETALNHRWRSLEAGESSQTELEKNNEESFQS